MLTDEQRLLFREILDLNWDFTHNSNLSEKFELAKKLNEKKKELKTSMGEEAYDKFINLGREMFAPKRELVEEED